MNRVIKVLEQLESTVALLEEEGRKHIAHVALSNRWLEGEIIEHFAKFSVLNSLLDMTEEAELEGWEEENPPPGNLLAEMLVSRKPELPIAASCLMRLIFLDHLEEPDYIGLLQIGLNSPSDLVRFNCAIAATVLYTEGSPLVKTAPQAATELIDSISASQDIQEITELLKGLRTIDPSPLARAGALLAEAQYQYMLSLK